MSIKELCASGEWQINRINYPGCRYEVIHIPTGKRSVCTGLNTLATVQSIMTEEHLSDNRYFRN